MRPSTPSYQPSVVSHQVSRFRFHDSGFKFRFGFTLVELLVVVGIIALLAGMLLPVIVGVIKKGEIAKAQHEVMALATAVQHYAAEYTKFPGQTSASGDKRYQGADYQNLLAVLQGTNIDAVTWINPRRMMFLELDQRSMTNGVYNDPWGHSYQVVADWNFDNTIDSPQADAETVPNKSVAVWSYGPSSPAAESATDSTHIRSWR